MDFLSPDDAAPLPDSTVRTPARSRHHVARIRRAHVQDEFLRRAAALAEALVYRDGSDWPDAKISLLESAAAGVRLDAYVLAWLDAEVETVAPLLPPGPEAQWAPTALWSIGPLFGALLSKFPHLENAEDDSIPRRFLRLIELHGKQGRGLHGGYWGALVDLGVALEVFPAADVPSPGALRRRVKSARPVLAALDLVRAKSPIANQDAIRTGFGNRRS